MTASEARPAAAEVTEGSTVWVPPSITPKTRTNPLSNSKKPRSSNLLSIDPRLFHRTLSPLSVLGIVVVAVNAIKEDATVRPGMVLGTVPREPVLRTAMEEDSAKMEPVIVRVDSLEAHAEIS